MLTRIFLCAAGSLGGFNVLQVKFVVDLGSPTDLLIIEVVFVVIGKFPEVASLPCAVAVAFVCIALPSHPSQSLASSPSLATVPCYASCLGRRAKFSEGQTLQQGKTF